MVFHFVNKSYYFYLAPLSYTNGVVVSSFFYGGMTQQLSRHFGVRD